MIPILLELSDRIFGFVNFALCERTFSIQCGLQCIVRLSNSRGKQNVNSLHWLWILTKRKTCVPFSFRHIRRSTGPFSPSADAILASTQKHVRVPRPQLVSDALPNVKLPSPTMPRSTVSRRRADHCSRCCRRRC